MATPFDQSSNLGEVFRKVLNRHGYGFHYRVMDEAGRLYDSQRSRWLFAVSEFPVTVRGGMLVSTSFFAMQIGTCI